MTAGVEFTYEVHAYGPDAETALREAVAWQTRPGLGGAGCAKFGHRTVPVTFGEPYPAVGAGGWRVPVLWRVTDEPWEAVR